MSATDPPTAKPIPEILRPLCPEVGSIWDWEPNKPHATARVKVKRVEWNSEEVWIEAVDLDLATGRPGWNTLARWIEAAVLRTPAEEVHVCSWKVIENLAGPVAIVCAGCGEQRPVGQPTVTGFKVGQEEPWTQDRSPTP